MGMQHTNILFPYEYILDADRIHYEHRCGEVTLGIRAEIGYDFAGYPVSELSHMLGGYNVKTEKRNPVQYLNKMESALAPFFSNSIESWQGQFIQQFNPYGGMTASQLVSFEGQITQESLTMQCEAWVTPYIKIGYYLPFYHFALSSLQGVPIYKPDFFENTICKNIYGEYQKTNAAVTQYELSGMGDSEFLISWQRYFIEERDFITGIFASIRAGLYFPTKMWAEQTQNLFLRVPFGYDAGFGIPFGGTIELDVNHCIGLGINADCVTFFPSLERRTIKTDIRQTDMLVANNALSMLNPGFRESFSVFGTVFNDTKTMIGTLCYQYNKQNESDIILCNTQFSNFIAQSASILDHWTNHNVIFSFLGNYTPSAAHYSFNYELFLKWGITGCRSIVGNSYGIQINIEF